MSSDRQTPSTSTGNRARDQTTTEQIANSVPE